MPNEWEPPPNSFMGEGFTLSKSIVVGNQSNTRVARWLCVASEALKTTEHYIRGIGTRISADIRGI